VLLWIILLSEDEEGPFLAISSEASFLYCPAGSTLGEIVSKGTSTSVGVEDTGFPTFFPFLWLTSLLSFFQMTDVDDGRDGP
jgi:hypothetical protein